MSKIRAPKVGSQKYYIESLVWTCNGEESAYTNTPFGTINIHLSYFSDHPEWFIDTAWEPQLEEYNAKMYSTLHQAINAAEEEYYSLLKKALIVAK